MLAALAGCGGAAVKTRPGGVAAHPLGTGTRSDVVRTTGAGVSGRPAIGAGPRFQPSANPGGPLHGACRPGLGDRFLVHVELFARHTVILVPAGVGARPPRALRGAYLLSARCFGPVVTIEPTGVLLVRPGAPRTLGDLFSAWGRPLTRGRLLSFAAGGGREVAAYVGGVRWHRDPRAIPLRRHAQIVIEVGRHVAPHRRYAFPPAIRLPAR